MPIESHPKHSCAPAAESASRETASISVHPDGPSCWTDRFCPGLGGDTVASSRVQFPAPSGFRPIEATTLAATWVTATLDVTASHDPDGDEAAGRKARYELVNRGLR